MRRGAKPPKGKAVAKRPPARKSPKGDGTKVRDLENRLAEALKREAEALEQQTATSEILRVISSSPTDVQPVFDVIVEQACRLCDAVFANAVRIDGDLMHNMAAFGFTPEAQAVVRRSFPMRPSRATMSGRAILERAVVVSEDASIDKVGMTSQEVSRLLGGRAMVSVPMLRDGIAVGAITLGRRERGRFPDRQIDLLKTFADQAVIAIENVRLFKELEQRNSALSESLEQQTATAEILRVISSSPTDVQPVFDTIVRSAVRLCDGLFGTLFQFDGELIYNVAQHNYTPEALEEVHRVYPTRPTRALGSGRAILERAVVHIPDVEVDPELQHRALSRAGGWRSGLFVPMLREAVPVGAIAVSRAESGPFSDNEIALLQTFADQAVIAIENVRLFKALEGRNRDLSEALEQQTATADVLRIIAESPTELQPVLDAIAARAVRLCEASDAVIERLEGDRFYNAAHAGAQMKGLVGLPLPLTRQFPGGRAVLDRQRVIIDDMQLVAETEYPDTLELLKLNTVHSCAEIPLLSKGKPLGNLAVLRAEVRPFTDAEVALLETFADQAVIAIENVRLFTELQTSNRELTTALDTQTATSDILRVISRSQTDVQPVFDAILTSAVRLLGAYSGALTRIAGDQIELVALTSADDAGNAALRALFPRSLQSKFLHAHAIRDRAPLNIADAQTDPRSSEAGHASAGVTGRSLAVVPLLRDGEAVGTISLTRRNPGGFTDDEIALLQTFADQAVIAIENVRLFTELEAKNRDLTESLEQQTATGEILRVISSSPTNVQPTFDAIAEHAWRLCGAANAAVFRFDGELIHLAAHDNLRPEWLNAVRSVFPIPPGRGSVTARAILTRAVVHDPDIGADSEHGYSALRAFGTSLSVPLLRDGLPLGAITVARTNVAPFSDGQIELLKTFADQAVIAIENVRLFTELQTSNRELTTALDTQTATSDILRVISRSQTDVQPVFDAILASAIHLLGAYVGALTRVTGDQIELAAMTSTDVAIVAVARALYPQPLQSAGAHAQAIRARAPLNIADAYTDPRLPESAHAYAQFRGYRSQVVVPMLRDDEAVGTIGVTRREPGGFTDDEIALLKTFADQAVIAVENARLLSELQERNEALTQAHAQVTEALEQQTATSEILRVISRSQTDVQPVFDTIVTSAVRLCDGLFSALFQTDGELLHFAAQHNYTPEALEAAHRVFPARPTRALGAGRAILERAVIQIPDMDLDPEFQHQVMSRAIGARSGLFVPMLREGVPIGVIGVARAEPGPFSDNEIELLKTFADQAVIAVENVRLFKELEARNRDLTEALDQQTATAEILRVISQSQTDVQPVFDTIVRSAVKLCDGLSSVLFQFDGELIHLVAQHNYTPEAFEAAHRIFPARPTRALGTGRAILERAVVHMPDVELDPEFQKQALSAARAIGYRSGLWVPMLREGTPIGVIVVTRAKPGPFSDSEIELLKTFADQAVIAVENVRLFKELEARTGELTQSVEKLTALGEVSRAVSSTLDVETVLDTIVSRASQLAGAAGCSIYEYDESAEQFELRATHNFDAEFVEAIRAAPLRKGEGLMGRAAEMREPIQIPDITHPGAYQSSLRATLIRFGYRALLAVPLLREDQIIGSLSFNRKAPGEFPPEVVDVLKTFATQSALAIQNARLFREIADKSAQLEVASRHKSEFLANMSHELRTPLNAIIGFSEVLSEGMFGEINEKQTEYLRDILESGRHLLSLINDILDLSKIEAGRMELELADFHLPQAIENAVVLVRERALRRGITLEQSIDPRLGEIQGDERKVKQVLLNLLSNALKFTPEGGRVEVRAGVVDSMTEISVIDTGVGIAPQDQEAVFEEFRQVGTADKKVEGTGLGLALSRKFIELHGGRIWVKSQVGAGSTFTFTLPLTIDQQRHPPS